jgi:hypothetical protein
MEVRRLGDLEIDEDMRHTRAEWKVERVTWVIMGLVVLAALSGLLGPGPLSGAAAGERAAGLQVSYERFERSHSQTMIRIEVGPPAIRDGAFQLWIGREYLDAVRVLRMDPEPDGSEVAPDRVIHSYRAPGGPVAINIHLEIRDMGRVRGRMGVAGGPEVHWTQLAYP